MKATPDTVRTRLDALRDLMRREHLGAFIVPTTDPHQSEYTAPHWKSREWLTGFDGSAGTAVVTLNSAALWTDSRYFLAAEEQLQGTGISLMREKIEGTPTIAEWIGKELSDSSLTEVGIDGTIAAAATVETLTKELRHHGGLTLRTSLDPFRTIWSGRPALPDKPVRLVPIEIAGEETPSKLRRIRQALRQQHHADGMLMAALDDIAWTLNLRGNDIHCNPLAIAYLLIATNKATLYINKEKLTPTVEQYLKACGIDTDDYENIKKGLKDYFEQTILMDPSEVSHALYQATPRERIAAPSPVPAMKAVKNTAERQGFAEAMLRDGVALVQFLMQLEQTDPATVTEIDIDQSLTSLRAAQPGFIEPSFDTIAAYGPHAAIVHYEATPETNVALQRRGLLLIDSGAQYDCGTTDVTRTIALGPLTEEEKTVYTLVLKGHLRLQNLVFPDGASGTQLDAIARSPLWAAGLNYLHGTGHGVGAGLCVHEGPHQIRMEWRPAPLHDGMTVTDEPGIYLSGRFGVRIENTLLVEDHLATECGRFLHFTPLTLCPIDRTPILRHLLSDEEVAWLDSYHQKVFTLLSPRLNEEERKWLQHATRPLDQ